MKVLIAIKSCEGDTLNGANAAIRETWAKDIPLKSDVAVLYFLGHTLIKLQSDEMTLACLDDYQSLPQKTRNILAWSLMYGYDFTFLCDTDTFVLPRKLLASGFQDYDLMGSIGGNTEKGKYYSWPSGGAGYWLSKAAAQIVTRAKSDDWAEDRMVGQALGPHVGISLTMKHHAGYGPDESLHTDITTHFCARGLHRNYDPVWMRMMYERNKNK